MTGLPVDNLWADLDFGSLTYMYDMLLPNITGWDGAGDGKVKANVMQYIFPTTPVTIGPGWILGRERIVTKVARSFTWYDKDRSHPLLLRVRYFDRKGWMTSTAEVQGPTVHVGLDASGARSFAVVVRETSKL